MNSSLDSSNTVYNNGPSSVSSPNNEHFQDYIKQTEDPVAPIFDDGPEPVPSVKRKKMFELQPRIAKKRKRNPENWKRNKAALLRQEGKEYISQTGRVVEKKAINEGILCKENCRKKEGVVKVEVRLEELLKKRSYEDNDRNHCHL
ncbi:hypothetical protein ABEB36_014154 [Hypothenemus hampei]|uniref:Uncharacterized protein n=1 Tax=Hypothenemus hampei TaxID=57062 RepID=A0ABD1E818_HYPHA